MLAPEKLPFILSPQKLPLTDWLAQGLKDAFDVNTAIC